VDHVDRFDISAGQSTDLRQPVHEWNEVVQGKRELVNVRAMCFQVGNLIARFKCEHGQRLDEIDRRWLQRPLSHARHSDESNGIGHR
jgi:hypothetical protein